MKPIKVWMWIDRNQYNARIDTVEPTPDGYGKWKSQRTKEAFGCMFFPHTELFGLKPGTLKSFLISEVDAKETP